MTGGYETFRVAPIVVCDRKSGAYRIERFGVDRDAANLAVFTQRIHISPGDYARLLGPGGTIMSDTHDEYRDHWEAIHEATGRVLIHGLGLGCYLKAILAKPEVDHVDVVERSEDVIALVRECYDPAANPLSDPRVTLHVADVFEQKWPAGSRWNVVWHDIWTNICEDDLVEHARLLRSFGSRCDWQGAWRHDTLLRYRRNSQTAPWR